jgi:TP901 family phage tail tape measure protein
MSKELEKAQKEAKALQDKQKGLAQSLSQTKEQLDKAGIGTRQLGSHQRELAVKTDQATAALKREEDEFARLNAIMKKQAQARDSFNRGMAARSQMQSAGMSMGLAGAATGLPFVKMVKDYSSYEQAMLGVARQVQGARDANGKLTAIYYEMGDGIKALSERIPMATTEIAALVEAGARMGIQGKKDLLAFAETTAITATAFDLPVDQIGESMGKLSNLYKIPISNIKELGDVINWLDDNALSKGGDIIDVMQRIAGTAATVKMSYRDAAALGSTFLSLGAEAHIAATASNAMMRELAIADMQPKRFQAGMSALGLNSKEIQTSMASNATGTILKVLDAVNKLPDTKQLEVMTQLFGKEYGDDAAKLAKNVEEYRHQLELAHATAAKGSMMREAGAKSDTLDAQYQLVKNRVFNESAALGNALRQPLMDLMGMFSNVLGRVTAWTKANPELTATLVRVGASIAVILTVLGGLALALAAFHGPMVIMRYGFAMLGPMIATIASVFSTVWPVALAIAKFALMGLASALRMIALLAVANPILALVAALAIAAIYVWRNWSTLGPKFWALWASIKSAAISAWAGIVNYVAGLAGRFMAAGAAMIDGLRAGIASKLAWVKAWLGTQISGLVGSVNSVLGIHSPSAVFQLIGNQTMQGLAIGMAGNRAPADTMHKISRNLTAAARIGAGNAPVYAARPALAASGGMSVVFNIYPASGQNADDIAQQVAAELERLERRRAARGRSVLADRD